MANGNPRKTCVWTVWKRFLKAAAMARWSFPATARAVCCWRPPRALMTASRCLPSAVRAAHVVVPADRLLVALMPARAAGLSLVLAVMPADPEVRADLVEGPADLAGVAHRHLR
jgi:hypothetical protein